MVPAGMVTVTRLSSEDNSTESFPVIKTPTGPRNRASNTPSLSGDEINGITPKAISPANTPPSTSSGSRAYMTISDNGRRDLNSAINQSHLTGTLSRRKCGTAWLIVECTFGITSPHHTGPRVPFPLNTQPARASFGTTAQEGPHGYSTKVPAQIGLRDFSTLKTIEDLRQ
jgi:hypothetical protein